MKLTSTVGFPRLSKIWRALTSLIKAIINVMSEKILRLVFVCSCSCFRSWKWFCFSWGKWGSEERAWGHGERKRERHVVVYHGREYHDRWSWEDVITDGCDWFLFGLTVLLVWGLQFSMGAVRPLHHDGSISGGMRKEYAVQWNCGLQES